MRTLFFIKSSTLAQRLMINALMYVFRGFSIGCNYLAQTNNVIVLCYYHKLLRFPGTGRNVKGVSWR